MTDLSWQCIPRRRRGRSLLPTAVGEQVVSASHLRPQNTALPGARSCPLSHSSRWCPSFTETDAQGSGTALSQWSGPHSAPGAAASVVRRTGRRPASCAAAACGHSRSRPPSSGLSPRLASPAFPLAASLGGSHPPKPGTASRPRLSAAVFQSPSKLILSLGCWLTQPAAAGPSCTLISMGRGIQSSPTFQALREAAEGSGLC